MRRPTKHQVLKTLNAATWLGAGVLATYTAVAAMYPARVLDTAWRERLVQACGKLRPRCEGVSIRTARIRDFWLGRRVEIQAPMAQAASVQKALAAASGAQASRYVEWSVAPAGPRQKS